MHHRQTEIHPELPHPLQRSCINAIRALIQWFLSTLCTYKLNLMLSSISPDPPRLASHTQCLRLHARSETKETHPLKHRVGAAVANANIYTATSLCDATLLVLPMHACIAPPTPPSRGGHALPPNATSQLEATPQLDVAARSRVVSPPRFVLTLICIDPVTPLLRRCIWGGCAKTWPPCATGGGPGRHNQDPERPES